LKLFVAYLAIGIFSGFMSGIFGIGGGSVRIPLLNLAGLPLLTAFGVNLFVIPFSSLIGAISQRANIDGMVALYVIIGGSLGSIIGALSVGLIPILVLAFIFVITAFVTILGMYLDRIAPVLYRRISPNARNIVLFSFLLNLITGIRGGSGGSLFPPFLRAFRLDIHKAIATSLFVTIFTASVAIIIYWQRGDIVYLPAFSVLAGSMIGAIVGSKISLRTKPFWLEIGLALFVISLALTVIYRAL